MREVAELRNCGERTLVLRFRNRAMNCMYLYIATKDRSKLWSLSRKVVTCSCTTDILSRIEDSSPILQKDHIASDDGSPSFTIGAVEENNLNSVQSP